MKIVVAIDSFKGSLSSFEAGNAVKAAVNKLKPEFEVLVRPLADGGEGTVEAMSGEGEKVTVLVTGPLEEKVKAE